ncbi:YybH family protein [Sunxiuqinia indica]|uniref:YybH family protein n=1 Tax=Sunxiuqinia indica TaxID=2692584 RepID=UPI00135BE0E8|nr:nuclear transport factor 2 family protein [Sunxiuqinia indica]
MKTNLTFLLTIMLAALIAACTPREQQVAMQEEEVDLINDEFTEAKEEVRMTMDSIAQSIKDGDIDRLISFHAYSPKFTEFKNGEVRNGAKANEEFERGVFGSVTEVKKFDMNDMKIAVYGDVANVTLHSDFQLKFENDLVTVNDQISLLFVDTENGWRIVHEHHSSLNQAEE